MGEKGEKAMLRQFFNKSNNNDKIQLYNSSCIQNKWLQMQ